MPFYTEYREWRANTLEMHLRELVAAGGRGPLATPDERAPWRRRGIDTGTVGSIKPDTRNLTIATKAEKLAFETTPLTRVMSGGRSATLADFKPGAKVSFDYWPDQVTPGQPTPLRCIGDGEDRSIAWIYGKITAVNPRERTLKILIDKPEPDALRGVKFWDDIPMDATPAPPALRSVLDSQRAWRDTPGDGVASEVLADAATTIFLDGKPSALADLKTGDAIGLGLRLRALDEPVLNPDLIRASRVP